MTSPVTVRFIFSDLPSAPFFAGYDLKIYFRNGFLDFVHNLAHPRLSDKFVQVKVDFEKLEEVLQDEVVSKESYDLAICVHGTTRAQAGSDVRPVLSSSCGSPSHRKPSFTLITTTPWTLPNFVKT